MRRFSHSSALGLSFAKRDMSFNAHAWISSLRYGFPCGPQLGSFAHQYCPVTSNANASNSGAPVGDKPVAAAAANTSSSSAAEADAKDDAAAAASPPHSSERATVYLGDMSSYTELKNFSYNRSPCRSAPKRRVDSGTPTLDTRAARLLLRRRFDAAKALHSKKPAAAREDGSSTITSPFTGEPDQTLTFDLLRQIREMYREEMLLHIHGGKKEEGEENKSATTSASGGAEAGGDDYPPRWKDDITLDDILRDDAAIYTRAIVYVSGGSRLARDWLAGLASVCASHQSIIAVAMHHQGTHEDLEDFARYCEIVGYCDDSALSLRNDSRLTEIDGGKALGGGGGVTVDLAAPLTPPRQADIIKRCLIYDSMTALHFMEFNADLLDLSRIRAAATYLGLSAEFVDQLRELVLAEHSLIAEKHATIDAPAAMAEGRLGLYSR